MWPLSVFLFLATAFPQQQPSNVAHDFLPLKLPAQDGQSDDAIARESTEESQRNTCYTMRSYFFRRQDGQAPVPAGMTTCTPANMLQKRQVSPAPRLMFVPLAEDNENR